MDAPLHTRERKLDIAAVVRRPAPYWYYKPERFLSIRLNLCYSRPRRSSKAASDDKLMAKVISQWMLLQRVHAWRNTLLENVQNLSAELSSPSIISGGRGVERGLDTTCDC